MLRSYQEPHKERLLAALLRNGAALDSSDTGTGKTYVALTICNQLGIVPLVVGPKSSRAGWEKAAQVIGIDIEFVNWEKLRGARRDDKAAETDWLEEVPWGTGSFVQWKAAPYLVIFDEAHRGGGQTTLNSKAIIAAKRQAQYVLALSATAADDPRQMKALGYALGLHGLSKRTQQLPDFIGWLMRHGCSPGIFGGYDFTPDMEKQEKVFKKINAAIFPHRGSRMRKSEIPSFPKTSVEIKHLSDDQGIALHAVERYKKLAAKGKAGLKEVQQLRMKLELAKIPHFIDMTKDAIRSSKVIIFVNFTETRHQLVAALEELKLSVGQIHGEDQSAEERAQILNDFQANTFDALVANSKAGGESANMHDPTGVVARTVYISPGDSGREFCQILGRANRDGGAFSQQYVCCFRGTYEEAMADRLQQKQFNIGLLNDGDFEVNLC
jgi:superfamily II DNA or RNA helicase